VLEVSFRCSVCSSVVELVVVGECGKEESGCWVTTIVSTVVSSSTLGVVVVLPAVKGGSDVVGGGSKSVVFSTGEQVF